MCQRGAALALKAIITGHRGTSSTRTHPGTRNRICASPLRFHGWIGARSPFQPRSSKPSIIMATTSMGDTFTGMVITFTAHTFTGLI